MPTIDELKGLITKTSTVNQPLNIGFFIDANYFPNTNFWFWSSSPYAYDSDVAWLVGFSGGFSDGFNKGVNGYVRLVRG